MSLLTLPINCEFVEGISEWLHRTLPEDPAERAKCLVLVPGRRACLALRDALAERSEAGAMLLPRILPIGDVDEDALVASTLAQDAELEESLPPAVGETARLMMLAELIAAHEWETGRHRLSKALALRLAGTLAELFDLLGRWGVEPERLKDITPDEFAVHWQQTLNFLDIVFRRWPQTLRREGRMDPAARRHALIDMLAHEWRERPPQYPVIAAGSTGSHPAAAELLKVVANLPNGTVILPGLDKHLSQEAWDAVDAPHPQFALKRFLNVLEATREDVGMIACSRQSVTPLLRSRLLSAAMLPAGAVEEWTVDDFDGRSSLEGLSRVDAAHPQEEADAIALILRQALNTPGRTAALVTHDRQLAQRVTHSMKRFDITLDDSAGMSLLDTAPGIFARLVADAAGSCLSPVPLLALLKHPLTALGMEPAQCRRLARKLEVSLLRGIRTAEGIAGLKEALKFAAVSPEDREEIAGLLHALELRLGRFAKTFRTTRKNRDMRLNVLLNMHKEAMLALAETDTQEGEARLYAHTAGQTFCTAWEDMEAAGPIMRRVDPLVYTELVENLLSRYTVRLQYGAHPRLHILSPVEARMQRYDMLVLGGLNENSWPPAVEANPWLSRPMLSALRLPAPEEIVGQAAHDFWMLAASTPKVVLTRSQKTESGPAEPARWLQRLDALLSSRGITHDEWQAVQWRAYAKAIRAPLPLSPLSPPAPRPPAEARPKRLSVTAIETLMRDPYAIYAREILKLRRLDALDEDPDASLFGELAHAALAEFTARWPAALPANAYEELMVEGERAFAPWMNRPAVASLWWPRFTALALWVVTQERARRAEIAQIHAEKKAEYTLHTNDQAFTLSARIDRIERLKSGEIAVSDYKTGSVPEEREMRLGIASQLALGALVATHSKALAGMREKKVAELSYWKLGASARTSDIKRYAKLDPELLVAEAEKGVYALVDAFGDPATAYLAQPLPGRSPRYNDYAALERVEEWEFLIDEMVG